MSILSSRLNETGWSDDLKDHTKGTTRCTSDIGYIISVVLERARNMNPLSFQTLFEDASPHAQSRRLVTIQGFLNIFSRDSIRSACSKAGSYGSYSPVP
jgi:G3E family GTPase